MKKIILRIARSIKNIFDRIADEEAKRLDQFYRQVLAE